MRRWLWVLMALLFVARVVPAVADVVEVTTDEAVLRVGPDTDCDRLTPQLAGNRLQVVGAQKDWLQVRLGPDRTAWIQSKDVKALPADTPLAFRLQNITSKSDADQIVVDFKLTGRGAVEAIDAESPTSLTVTFSAMTLAMLEATQPEGTEMIRAITLEQRADGVAMVHLRMATDRLWGYRLRPSKDGVALAIRKPPAHAFTVVLDPGHGGSDSGAIGRDGLKEKQINLEVALQVRRLLQKAGIKVVMTHATDRAVAEGPYVKEDELEARVLAARQARGTIFVSIHHNARPDVKAGRVSHGSYVYYYHAQSRALAQSIEGPMGRAIGEPDRGIIWRSFYVIRESDMPAVLCEVQFISNPRMEARMQTEAYVKAAAEGIAKGILHFLHG
ncbi:MAG: N-acetylmuramoyl-L-alanine amidase [Candidatus Xenobia bacterium]